MTTTAPDTTSGRRRTILHLGRRLPLMVAAALVPLVPGAPAFAADNVICVGAPAGPCNETAASISAAITAANANGVADTILVGPGTYSDGPYDLNGSLHAVSLKGAGQDATFLTLPAAASEDTYLSAYQATVQDLTITMAAATSTNDTALNLFHATAVAIRVDGAGTHNATAVEVTSSAISMSAVQMGTDSDNYGVFSRGDSTVTDSTITGEGGFVHSGANTTDSVSRVVINAGYQGIATDSGTVNVDDAVIDLGASAGTGLAAVNFNASISPRAINANHVTVVGGAAGSKGAWAYAANPNALQLSTIQLDNSIVRGPATALEAIAGNNGAQGGPSTATITTSYSSWSTKTETSLANGTAQVVIGPGNLNADPAFADAAGGNYRLTPGSPVADHGDPAPAGPASDLDGHARVADSDGNGTAVRDMGAYELDAAAPPGTPADTVAPETTVLTGPIGPTADATPTFTFSSESGAGFACKVDAGAFAACSGPAGSHTTAPLGDGAHTFFVRATDAASNVDATPAARSFTVDTVAPATTIKSKPAKVVTRQTVKFRFSSNETGVTFTCKLDKRAWRPCTSPKKLRIKVGQHRFSVRATDAAGNTDATPARYRFRRVHSPS